jgi:hypothetical protein
LIEGWENNGGWIEVPLPTFVQGGHGLCVEKQLCNLGFSETCRAFENGFPSQAFVPFPCLG